MWFKEYIFNVLIQPFHLLIYTILVGSAITLASTSLVYAVIAIYFVIPAEKLLRKFFGFDNAGTLSAAGSFAGGALFSAMINKINKPKPSAEKDDGEKPKNLRKNSSIGGVNADEAIMGTYNGGANAPGGNGSPVIPQGGQANNQPNGQGTGGRKQGLITFDENGKPVFNTQAEINYDKNGKPIYDTQETPLPGEPSQQGYGSSYVPTKGLTDPVLPNGRLGILTKGAKGKDAFKNAGMSILNRGGQSLAAMGYSARRQLENKAKTLPKSAGRWLRRGVVGGVAGGTAALLAAGAAASTGDPTKALGLATAAGAAGYNFGNYYGDKVAKTAGTTLDSGRAAFWGNDLKKIEQHKFDQEFLKSPELMDTLTKTLGTRDAAREAIKQGDVQAFLNNNITDKTKIARALKLKRHYQNNKGLSDGESLQKAVAMAKWSRDVNPGIFQPNSREQISWKNNLTQQLTAQGMNAGQARSRVDEILDELAEYFES